MDNFPQGSKPEPGSQFVKYNSGAGPLPPSTRPNLHFSNSRGGSHIGLFVTLFIVLIILGAVGYLYFYILNPERAIPQAIGNYLDSNKIRSDFNFNIYSGNGQFSTTTLVFVHTHDRTNPDDVRNQTDIDVRSGSYRISGEVRLIGNSFYAQVTRLNHPILENMGIKLKKWYSLPLSKANSLSSDIGLDASMFPREQFTSVVDAYARLHVLGVISDFKFVGFSFVQGKPVRRYSMTINKEPLVDAILSYTLSSVETRDMIIAQVGSIDFKPIIVSTELLSGSLVQVTGGINVDVPETQLGKADSIKVRGVLTYDDALSEDLAVNTPTKVVAYTSPTNSRPNQTTAPQTPPSAPLVEDPTYATYVPPETDPYAPLAQDPYIPPDLPPEAEYVPPPVYGTADVASKNSSLQVAINNSRTAITASFTSGYSGACSSAVVQPYFDQIMSLGSVPICMDTPATYFLLAPLASADDTESFYCVDSVGNIGVVYSIPSGGSCK